VAPRPVLVTGASSGIGRACALRLAGAGWWVFAGVRRAEDAAALKGAAAAGAHLDPVSLDVTDETSVAGAIETITGRTGGTLSAVVNNAGTAFGGPIEYLGLEEWRRQFEVNLFGQLAVTRAALPLLRAGEDPRVVFIGSIGARVPSPLLAPYTSSKAALATTAATLRQELAPFSFKVVLVEPGAVKTPIWEKGRHDADRLERDLDGVAAARYRKAIESVRAGIDMQDRNGISPETVAEVVVRALTARRPRSRYTVGTDARLMGLATRLLPDVALDGVVALAGRAATRARR
jgi:NAD(P)-dependent dehydrogenase (short-subunit alcohol dehydrogenase family)